MSMQNYILQNSDKCYLNKELQWCSNILPDELFKTEHRDIALNQLIELNAKDINLRATVINLDSEALAKLFAQPKSANAA